MPISIQPLKEAHLGQIEAIEQASFSQPWSREAYRKELSNPLAHYVVLEDSGTVVAYGNFWLTAGEAQINNLAVAPSFRGQGYGTRLMEELIALARSLQASAMTLEVRPANERAVHLYQQAGFVAAGVRPHYYADGGDALIMWKYF